MVKSSGWDKARTYIGLGMECTSTYVVASCLSFAGKTLIKNPIIKVMWYIGSVGIGSVVGSHVGRMYMSTISEIEEGVTDIQKAVDEVLNASEVV